MDTVADLRATRRYLTAFLLNVDINVTEMSISTLLEMLDYFAEHPEEYKEMISTKSAAIAAAPIGLARHFSSSGGAKYGANKRYLVMY